MANFHGMLIEASELSAILGHEALVNRGGSQTFPVPLAILGKSTITACSTNHLEHNSGPRLGSKFIPGRLTEVGGAGAVGFNLIGGGEEAGWDQLFPTKVKSSKLPNNWETKMLTLARAPPIDFREFVAVWGLVSIKSRKGAPPFGIIFGFVFRCRLGVLFSRTPPNKLVSFWCPFKNPKIPLPPSPPPPKNKHKTSQSVPFPETEARIIQLLKPAKAPPQQGLGALQHRQEVPVAGLQPAVAVCLATGQEGARQKLTGRGRPRFIRGQTGLILGPPVETLKNRSTFFW